MLLNKDYKFWFCTGSQDLYGEECLAKVARHSKQIVDELNKTGVLPYEIVWKPTLITNELIRKTFNEANNDETCAGVITWMHTFSPAKSWILGLQEYRKPLMHLHTQFNEELPYDTIDMDFMNENQSAHGDREYGHIVSRMRMERKVVVGHWTDPVVVDKIAVVRNRQPALYIMRNQRLGIRAYRRTRRGIAHMPDRNVARQTLQLFLGKYFAYQTHVLVVGHHAPVGYRYAAALLPAVLKRKQTVVYHRRNIAPLGIVYAEYAAFLVNVVKYVRHY